MSVKQTVQEQYRSIVDFAQGSAIQVPEEGWIRTVRKALGMSGAQLARRLGVTRARIAQAEKAELDGGVTLKSMQMMAEAMGCRFVYAFEPPGTIIENVIIDQARRKAEAIVGLAAKHMALENQALPESSTKQEIGRVMADLMHDMPVDFWDGP
ncbi:MAG: mobile mystery protein A [Rhizobiaceae bacterium]